MFLVTTQFVSHVDRVYLFLSKISSKNRLKLQVADFTVAEYFCMLGTVIKAKAKPRCYTVAYEYQWILVSFLNFETTGATSWWTLVQHH